MQTGSVSTVGLVPIAPTSTGQTSVRRCPFSARFARRSVIRKRLGTPTYAPTTVARSEAQPESDESQKDTHYFVANGDAKRMEEDECGAYKVSADGSLGASQVGIGWIAFCPNFGRGAPMARSWRKTLHPNTFRSSSLRISMGGGIPGHPLENLQRSTPESSWFAPTLVNGRQGHRLAATRHRWECFAAICFEIQRVSSFGGHRLMRCA